MNATRAYWDKLADDYDRRIGRIRRKAYRETIAHAKKYAIPEYTLLDFGCGTGGAAIELSESVAKTYAVDFSESMLGVARTKARSLNAESIEFIHGDIFDCRFDDMHIDMVCAFNVLPYLDDPARTLKRIYDILRSGGVFITASDCLGERRTPYTIAVSLLVKAGLLPQMHFFAKAQLAEMIDAQNFHVVDNRDVHPLAPKNFIAAKQMRDIPNPHKPNFYEEWRRLRDAR